LSGAAPKRGSVIRYGYLWARESKRGQEEGRKDRPALVIALSVQTEDGETRIFASAITHSPPFARDDAVEIPAITKRKLGLDSDPAWIVTTEVNEFVWPGPDVLPVPGRPPGTLVYGEVPDDLLQRAIKSFVENRRKQRAIVVRRSF